VYFFVDREGRGDRFPRWTYVSCSVQLLIFPGDVFNYLAPASQCFSAAGAVAIESWRLLACSADGRGWIWIRAAIRAPLVVVHVAAPAPAIPIFLYDTAASVRNFSGMYRVQWTSTGGITSVVSRA